MLTLLLACGGKKTYAVTFDSDGGSGVSPSAVTEGEPVGIPAAPFKDKYDFIGWYLNGAEYDFSAPVTSDIQLTAKWAPTVDVKALAGKWIGQERAAGKEYSYTLIISSSGALEFSYIDGATEVAIDVVGVSSVKGLLRVEYFISGQGSKYIDF